MAASNSAASENSSVANASQSILDRDESKISSSNQKVTTSPLGQPKKTLNDLQAQQRSSGGITATNQSILQPTMLANQPSTPPIQGSSISSTNRGISGNIQRKANQRNSSTSSSSSNEKLGSPSISQKPKQTLQQLQAQQREAQTTKSSSGILQPMSAGNSNMGVLRPTVSQSSQATLVPQQSQNLQSQSRMPTSNYNQSSNSASASTSTISQTSTILNPTTNPSSNNMDSMPPMMAPVTSLNTRPPLKRNESLGSIGMNTQPRQQAPNMTNNHRPLLNQRSQSFDQSLGMGPPMNNNMSNFNGQRMPVNTMSMQPQGNVRSNGPANNLDQFMLQQFNQQRPQSSIRPTNLNQFQNTNMRQQFPGNPSQPMGNMMSQQQVPMQAPNLQQRPGGMYSQQPMQPLIPQSSFGRPPLQPMQANQNTASQNTVDLKDIFG